jgi:hypothetical protein
MKKLILITIALALTACLYGQKTTGHIISGYYIVLPSKDTVRTFSFNRINIDTCRNRLIKYWGTPTQNTTGNMTWTNKEIPNIGKDLKINLSDEFCIIENDQMTCKTFKDENDKAEKLKNINPHQFRDVTITLTDKSNKNLIMNKTQVEIVVRLLATIIK